MSVLIPDRDENGNLLSTIAIKDVAVENNRLQNMNNRVPNGYSLYVVGESDDIANGIYGGGDELQFSESNNSVDFRLLNHYYAIGARAIWSGCDINNYFNATLIAPASSGATNQTGDYDKVEIIPSSGLHLFKPVDTGTGSWDMTLTDTLTNTSILKATPVPATGNNGWFDYDSTTNILTANMEQTGGYNLYDFDVNLHSFGRKVWGTPQSGGITALDITDLVGKLLFNSWKINFTFDVSDGVLSSEKAAVILILATKQNI